MTTLRTLAAAVALVSLPTVASAQSAAHGSANAPSIVEIASQNGNFKTLVTALKAAGLVETLQGSGPFTVFAPTDAAFAKLPAGTVEALLKDKEKLASILTYHVVAGKVMAGDIVKRNGAKPATVNGQTLDITLKGGKVYANNALVSTADIVASNGVIHVIDTVVLPKTN